jgi:hypothetical protein
MCTVALWGGSICGPTMALSFVIFPASYSILCAALVIWWSPGEKKMVFDKDARTTSDRQARHRYIVKRLIN